MRISNRIVFSAFAIALIPWAGLCDPPTPVNETMDRGAEESVDRQRPPSPQAPKAQLSDSRRGRSSRGAPRLDWVYVAFDYDRDGVFDGYEYVHEFDLEEARRRSRDRRQTRSSATDVRAGETGKSYPLARRQNARPLRRYVRTAEGKIVSMTAIELAGKNEPHVFARVLTDNGLTAKVDLGPEPQVKRLDLSAGDRATVRGYRGFVNDRPVLLAWNVSSGDRSVAIDRSRDRNLWRIRGTLDGADTVKFKGETNGRHYLIRLRRNQASSVWIDLGSPQIVDQAPLEDGDAIQVLGYPIWIDDQPAYRAVELWAGGKKIRIERSAEAPRGAVRRPKSDEAPEADEATE